MSYFELDELVKKSCECEEQPPALYPEVDPVTAAFTSVRRQGLFAYQSEVEFPQPIYPPPGNSFIYKSSC